MNPVGREISAALGEVSRRFPGHPDGLYAIPWYLVLGDPGSGRSSAIRAMQLTWSHGDKPLAGPNPEPTCSIWMPAEAVLVEPSGTLVGPRAHKEAFAFLGNELRSQRPREAVDGILLVLSAADLMDLDDRGLEAYAARQRAYLVDAAKHLHADVPTYVVVTRCDTLFGFAEVFAWTPDRKNEEPWGFSLPLDTDSQSAGPRLRGELAGLLARFEAMCFAKVSSDDPPEARSRAFQHLAEATLLMDRLSAVLTAVAMASAYERAPWIRALIAGSAIPGVGDRQRALVARYTQFGLVLAGEGAPRSARPGGLPLFAFFNKVVLPERDIVPTRKRFRDDALSVWTTVGGGVLLLAAILVGVIVTVLRSSGK